MCASATLSSAQQPASRPGTRISGRVVAAESRQPVVSATVAVESAPLVAITDSMGAYQLTGVPSGPQVLLVRRLGYAATRVQLTVPASGSLTRDIEMARASLRLPSVQVTADAAGRARGELGTASVITREAIANQNAVSLAGVLELLPGIPLSPPGLDNVQQISLRTVPTTSGTAEQLGAFGTLIILDGVPLSNNVNLQSTGTRGEIIAPTSAGGGVDLRRIPAAALERVEVIRGVPSARYGDLTQGAIIVDTRAGIVEPDLLARYDPRTTEASFTGGWAARAGKTAAASLDAATTKLQPGLNDANVWRITATGSHRAVFGSDGEAGAGDGRLTFDTRASLDQLYLQQPEEPDVRPGSYQSDRSGGMRLSERARSGSLTGTHVELTLSLEREWQRTVSQELLLRGASPFTDRLTEGRTVGHFVLGEYPAAVRLSGDPWHVYSRLEAVAAPEWLGGTHALRVGSELRREWNGGPGYQFAIEFPPQVTFNGVNGFDRPRRFDAIPPLATTGLYLDDRFRRSLPAGMALELQAGARVDVLHAGTWWTSGARSTVIEPRLNAQLSPRPWVRLRAGWGTTAKTPSLDALYPAPQYYDVVNVNWFPPDPAERLAVLTTFIRDPTNPKLGFSVGHKSEAGFEVDLGQSGAAMSVTGFHDVITGGVGFAQGTGFILREHFALTDSSVGTGRRPDYIVPAQAVDTVPIFIDRPSNLDRLDSRGVEWTLALPPLRRIDTRVELQGAWVRSAFSNNALDLGARSALFLFQQDSLIRRRPYWLGSLERGERALATGRVIHHEPALGLIITGTVQYFIRENSIQEGATDTLAFAGYVTRNGQLFPVPPEQRGAAQFADLRQRRSGLFNIQQSPLPDWLFSLQVAKAVAGTGRVSFYAFNALDRLGRPATLGRASRIFPRVRFGVELTLPTSALTGLR